MSRTSLRSSAFIATTALAALIAAAPVCAQSPASGPDIVVSASRVPLPARETGAAVTVLTERELEARDIRVVSDILRDVPGVAVNRSGPVGSFTQVRIRGAEGNQTLVLIDGIEMNNPAGGSEFDLANLVAADIARIEILRGPQSALYGSDAIGGVINIITKTPQKGWQGTLRSEGGSFATWNNLVNAGYGAEKFYFSGTLARMNTNGVSVADERAGNAEDDGYTSGTTRLKMGFKPLPNLNFEAVGMEINSQRYSDDSSVNVGAKDSFGWTTEHQRYGLVKGAWSLYGGAWEHVVRAAYGDDGKDFFNASGSRTYLSEGTKTKYDYQTNITFATEGSANAEHTVTLAVEREYDQQFTNSSYSGLRTVGISSTGYVGEYRVSLWDKLFLSGSLRRDINDQLFDNQTTWRGTAAYLHNPWDVRFHGSIGRGIKNPTLYELYGSTATFTGNENLVPEESIGGDFGVEKTLQGGKLIVDVTLFRNRFKNYIDGSGNTATNKAGTTRADGMEVTVVAHPRTDFRIDASYTFTDAEDGDGIRLIRRPRHTASINGTYLFNLDQRPARFNLGLRYNGTQTDTVYESYSPTRTHTERLQEYTLLNAGFAWDLRENIQLFARGENLLGQNYQDVFGYGTPGRAAYAGIRINFGPTEK